MGLDRFQRVGSDDISLSPGSSESSVSPGGHGWGRCQELAPTTSPRLRDLQHFRSLQSHLVDMVGENAKSWLRRPLLVSVTYNTFGVFSLTWWTWLGKMPRVGSDDLSLSPWLLPFSESWISPGGHGWGKCRELAPMISPCLRNLHHCQSLQSHLVDMVGKDAESWLRRPLLVSVTSRHCQSLQSHLVDMVGENAESWVRQPSLVSVTSRQCQSLQSHLVDMVGENAESWLRRPLLVFMTSVTVRVFSLTWWIWLGKMPRVGSDDFSSSPWPPSLSESDMCSTSSTLVSRMLIWPSGFWTSVNNSSAVKRNEN